MGLLNRRVVEVLICLPVWSLVISQQAIADCVDSGTFENPSGIIDCTGTSTGPFVNMSNYHLVDFIDVTVQEGAITGVMGFGMDHNGALVNNGVIVGTEIRPLQPTSLSIIGDWMIENNGLIGYSGERLVSPRGSPVSGAGSAIQLFGGNTVINRGQIITTPNAELAEGIFALPLVTIWNTETGLIETGGFRSDAIAAIGIPDPDDPTAFGSIVNDGTIVTTGDSSSAINLLWQGDILNNGEVIADGLRSDGIVMTGGSFGKFFMEKIDDVSGNIIEQVAGPTPTIQGILSYYQDLDIPDSWLLLPDELYAAGSIANNGSVTVTGDDFDGSVLGIAILGTQNGMITNSGTIAVSGMNAVGIGLFGQGTITHEQTGTIVAVGVEAEGISAEAFEEADVISIESSGNISVEGEERVVGIGVTADNARVSLGGPGGITATGTLSTGIEVLGDYANVSNSGLITVSGLNSDGIGIDGHGCANAADCRIENSGTISTRGNHSDGIAISGNNQHIINRGQIYTRNSGAEGILLEALKGGNILNEGTIETNGPDAKGIQAQGDDITILNASGASISTASSGGHGIMLGLQGQIAQNAEIKNAGIIDTTGEGASGVLAFVGGESTLTNTGRISVIGNDAIAASVLGGDNTVVNEGLMESGSRDIAIDEAVQPPDPNNPPEGRVGIYFEGKTTIENRFDAELQAFGENAAAVRSHDGGDSSSLSNDGVIRAFGKNAAGVDIRGDNVTFTNVSDSSESPFTKALIDVEGENAAGVKTSGAGAFISSRETETAEGVATTSIKVTGDNAVGIDATATGSGGFLIENAGQLIANGVNAIGMALRNAIEGTLDLILASGSSACAGGAKGAALSNCGEISVSGDNSVGLLAEGINDSSVINFGAVTAGGESAVNAVAIKLDDGQGGAFADNNFVLNIADATASGENAKGVSIYGDINLFVQGNDALVLPVAPDTFTTIQAFVDKVEARTGPGGSNETEVFPLGGVRASGDNAVGVYVEGNNNIIGVPVGLSNFDPTGNTPGLPTAPKIASVIATGTGSIGVQLDGNVNTLSNFGIVSGEQFSVLGGYGVDIVIAAGAFDGAIDLGDGMDEFNLLGGTEGKPFEGLDIEKFSSVIDGGGGNDVLRIIDSNFFGGDSSSSGLPDEWLGFGDESVDSDRIVNFEFFDVEVDGRVTLMNTLDVFQVSVLDGDLHLDDATILADEILISVFGELSGDGVVSTAPRVDNPDGLKGDVELLGGGKISPGDSPGILTLESNFYFGGTLEIELAGLEAGMFDRLIVDGDMTIDGGILDILLLDDFAPQVGDTFEFLTVTGDLSGLDTLQFMTTNAAADIDFDLSLMALTGGGFKIDLITMAADFDMSEVPLPATWLLFLTGFGGAMWLRRQRRAEGHLAPRRAALSV